MYITIGNTPSTSGGNGFILDLLVFVFCGCWTPHAAGHHSAADEQGLPHCKIVVVSDRHCSCTNVSIHTRIYSCKYEEIILT